SATCALEGRGPVDSFALTAADLIPALLSPRPSTLAATPTWLSAAACPLRPRASAPDLPARRSAPAPIPPRPADFAASLLSLLPLPASATVPPRPADSAASPRRFPAPPSALPLRSRTWLVGPLALSAPRTSALGDPLFPFL